MDMVPIAPHLPARPRSAQSCSTSFMCSWARRGCKEDASSPSCCCELLHPVPLHSNVGLHAMPKGCLGLCIEGGLMHVARRT